MNKQLLNFIIDSHTKIKIQQPTKNYTFDYYDEANFIFQHYQHQYVLENTHVNLEVEAFQKTLKDGLQNKLQLDIMFINNVGNYWNHVLNKKNKDDKFDESYTYLTHFLLFGSAYTTFIYNDDKANIIFEITPLYPYTYAYGKKKPTYGHFLKWIETYKPLYKCIISQQIAQQWIAQCQEILDVIDENSKKLYE